MENFIYFIGIDVSKNHLDTCILESLSTPIKHRKFENTRSGNKALIKWAADECRDIYKCLFCLEHTGVYAVPICIILSELKCFFSLVPPIEIQRSVGFKRGKTDKADAKAIAQFGYLRKDVIQLSVLPEQKLAKLQHLLSFRLRMIRSRHAFEVAAGESSKFIAKEVYREVTKQSKELTTLLNKRVKKLELYMQNIIKSDDRLLHQFNLLTSIPGIGSLIAIELLVSTHCFTTFDNGRKFACYCGVAPFEYKSGTSVLARTKVSGYANKKLKSLLNLAVLVACRKDYQFKNYYQRKTAEGKNGMLVLNNLRNKLIARIFATIKRGTPYVRTMQFAV